MKIKLVLFFTLFGIVQASYSQCSLSVSGNDFIWCNPCGGTANAIGTGGTEPYSFLWSNGDTTAQISNLCEGTYSVEVTDADGCTATDSVTINQIGTPMTVNLMASAPSSPTSCDICVVPIVEGGCTPYQIFWPVGEPMPCSACPFTTLEVIVTDACGCSISDEITTDTVAIGNLGLTAEILRDLKIYPNPTNDIFVLELIGFSEAAELKLYDLKGELISRHDFNSRIEMNIEHLAKGVYMGRVNTAHKTFNFKVVKD